MADKPRPRRRGRRLLFAAALGWGAWYLWSRRAGGSAPDAASTVPGSLVRPAASAPVVAATGFPVEAAQVDEMAEVLASAAERTGKVPAADRPAGVVDATALVVAAEQSAPAPAGPPSAGPVPQNTPRLLLTPAATAVDPAADGSTASATTGEGAPSLPDGSPPGPDYTIKGNAGSMLFHPPTSPYYKRTKAELWFRTSDEARAAGFTEWTPRKRADR